MRGLWEWGGTSFQTTLRDPPPPLCHEHPPHRTSLRRCSCRLFLFAGTRLHTSAYVSIRQNASACVSIRQHTSAYVSIRQHTSAGARRRRYRAIRQHTSAYVSIRQHTSAYVNRQLERSVVREPHYLHTSTYVSIRQHTSAYVSIRQLAGAGGSHVMYVIRSCSCVPRQCVLSAQWDGRRRKHRCLVAKCMLHLAGYSTLIY